MIALHWLTSHTVKNCIHFIFSSTRVFLLSKKKKNGPVCSVGLDGLTVLLLTLKGGGGNLVL